MYSSELERIDNNKFKIRGLIPRGQRNVGDDDVIAKDAFELPPRVLFRMPRSTLLLPLWELVVEITKRGESRKKGCTSARLIF